MKRRFRTNILVRNNRIKEMEELGIVVNHKILSNEKYLEELKNKLVEETNEVIEAKNIDELSAEICDVLEVVEHIIDAYKLDMNYIQQLKKKKEDKVGKFDKKNKTFWVEIDEENPEIDYYLSRPTKYPEIFDEYGKF